jgi:putative hemolysin
MRASSYCLAIAAWLTAACAATAPPPVQLANPASRHCVEAGGKLVIERAEGGEIGVCMFEDNRQCEEWALLRGRCPPGGIRVAGYATAAARHCAITGGRYTITARSGAADEQGVCDLGKPE